MNDLFVCGDVAMRQSEIRQVVMLEGSGSITNISRKPESQLFFLPRLVVNGNHLFESDQGLRALDALLECGYLTPSQKDAMKETFQMYLDSFALVFPPEPVAS